MVLQLPVYFTKDGYSMVPPEPSALNPPTSGVPGPKAMRHLAPLTVKGGADSVYVNFEETLSALREEGALSPGVLKTITKARHGSPGDDAHANQDGEDNVTVALHPSRESVAVTVNGTPYEFRLLQRLLVVVSCEFSAASIRRPPIRIHLTAATDTAVALWSAFEVGQTVQVKRLQDGEEETKERHDIGGERDMSDATDTEAGAKYTQSVFPRSNMDPSGPSPYQVIASEGGGGGGGGGGGETAREGKQDQAASGPTALFTNAKQSIETTTSEVSTLEWQSILAAAASDASLLHAFSVTPLAAAAPKRAAGAIKVKPIAKFLAPPAAKPKGNNDRKAFERGR